jgi:hypothetical protein
MVLWIHLLAELVRLAAGMFAGARDSGRCERCGRGGDGDGPRGGGR